MGLALLLLLVSMAVILVAAELFTNGVEWFGHRMKLGEGAVGSLLAAVGTAMPETIVPLIAILLVGGAAGKEIGVGAIIGAPFMLATAAFFVIGASVFIFSFTGRRGPGFGRVIWSEGSISCGAIVSTAEGPVAPPGSRARETFV